MNFNKKVALVTGASSGIGEGLARKLHKLGAKVIIVARRKDRLDVIEKELNSIRPGSAEAIAADISASGVDTVLSYLTSNQIDILVNNAGRGSFGRFEELDLREEEALVNLNITAGLKLTHAVIPQMKKRSSGWIINVSSVAGLQPIPYMATYSATKAFNLHHSLALHGELSKFGIRVIAVCPGPVETEFGEASRVPNGTLLVRADSVDTVVNATVRAMESSKSVITPGLLATVLAFFVAITPRQIRAWALGKILSGRSKLYGA